MATQSDAPSAVGLKQDDSPSIEARLATLEERTTPKQKTALDIIKEWSGFATAVIAILYTFPLGFWDRWFEGPTARNVEALRTGVQQLAELEARTTQGALGIPDIETRQFYINAMGAQRAAILARLETRLSQYRNELTIPELILLGYNLGIAGQIDFAESIYEAASQNANRFGATVSLRADIYRMRALLAAQQFNERSIVTVRNHFTRNITLLSSHTDIGLQQQVGISALQWSALELTLPRGDVVCSQRLREWAAGILLPIAQINPQIIDLLAAHDRRMSGMPPRADQEFRGCPPEIPPPRMG